MNKLTSILVAVIMISATTLVTADIMMNGPISSLLGVDQDTKIDRYTVDIDTEVDLGTLCSGSYSSYTVGTSSYDGAEATVSGSTATFTSVGIYLVSCLDEDGAVVLEYEVLADGEVSITASWDYSSSSSYKTPGSLHSKGGRSSHSSSTSDYTLTLSVSYADYIHYVELYSDSERISYYLNKGGATTENVEHDTSFVDYDDVQDEYITAIAEYIESVTSGKSQQYVANVVLAFVQSLDYIEDSTAHGVDEYWQFPLETLFLGGGDCEDTSILYCAIMKELGYDSCLFIFTNHMATGVALDSYTATRTKTSSSIYSGASGWYLVTGTDENGDEIKTAFYYGETTADGWYIGEIPSSVYSNFKAGFLISASTEETE